MSDRCPSWARTAIEQLRQVEVFLGNVPKSSAWQSEHVAKAQGRAYFPDNEVFDDDKADLIFERIVSNLKQEGFAFEQIATFVNEGIAYEGGPPYCNAAEVQEACQGERV